MPDPSAVAVFADLREEGSELEALVRELPAPGWAAATPASGWSIAHQIAHLHWTDRAALLSLTDPAGFGRMAREAVAAPESFVDEGAAEGPGWRPPSCSPAGGRPVPSSTGRSPSPRPTPGSPGTGRR
ncbi:hypothetical protein GCM10020254_47890 [Streptomyces goshikiensis]